MDKIKSVHILCGHCNTRFPSPIMFGDVQTFESATTAGNIAQCPRCRTMINCNKDNMSYVLADDSGGSVGPNFGGNT
jgi:hypothetical protein